MRNRPGRGGCCLPASTRRSGESGWNASGGGCADDARSRRREDQGTLVATDARTEEQSGRVSFRARRTEGAQRLRADPLADEADGAVGHEKVGSVTGTRAAEAVGGAIDAADRVAPVD